MASLASGKELDAIYLDFSKSFDKVSQKLLLLEIKCFGVAGSLFDLFRSYLSDRKQRVALDGALPNWLPVITGVPQGSVLGPFLFLVYANGAHERLQFNSNIALFANETNLYRVINHPNAPSRLQGDLACLYRWSLYWAMSCNASGKVLHNSKKEESCAKDTFRCYKSE